MASSVPRIYWDTDVWIDWNQNTRGKQELLRSLISRAEAGQYEIVVSPLSVAEFAPQDTEVQEEFDRYLNRSCFVIASVNLHVGQLARNLVARTRHLRGPDALHIAAALYARSQFLFSYDGLVLSCDTSEQGLLITEPQEVDQQLRLL